MSSQQPEMQEIPQQVPPMETQTGFYGGGYQNGSQGGYAPQAQPVVMLPGSDSDVSSDNDDCCSGILANLCCCFSCDSC